LTWPGPHTRSTHRQRSATACPWGETTGSRRGPLSIARSPRSRGSPCQSLFSGRPSARSLGRQGPLGRFVVADLLGRDVELRDLHVLGVARRLPKWQIQLKREPTSGWSSDITPLPIGERSNEIFMCALKQLRTKLRLSFESGQKSMPIKRRLNCAAYLSVLPDTKSVIRISD
jgi:hypothetical protein